MKRRKHSLAKRYGHMSMKAVEDVTSSIRKIAKDNPEVTAIAAGGAVGALAAGMGPGTGALLGAAAAWGAEKLNK
jgi:outer membrane lipoprotein SlyB